MYSGHERAIAEAKALCAGCEIREDCLELALALRDEHGVWGGLTAAERKGRTPSGRPVRFGSAVPVLPRIHQPEHGADGFWDDVEDALSGVAPTYDLLPE